MVKEYLSQKGVAYIERDVASNPSAAQEMISRTGQRGVPVIIINGQIIVGFDQPKLDQALSGINQQRPGFGTAIADTDKVKALFGSGIAAGAYIGRVRPESKAADIGLLPGDIVLEINQYRIANAADMESIISRLRPGDKISLVFLRSGQSISREGIF
jgi:glutaredoxin 3